MVAKVSDDCVELPLLVGRDCLRAKGPRFEGFYPREYVVPYLSLFPPEKRRAMWGYLGNSPSFVTLVDALGGMSGVRRVDECVNVRVLGDKYYITEQRSSFDDEYDQFGFYKFYINNEFAARGLMAGVLEVDSERLKDGYCYLSLLGAGDRMCGASAFGAFPLAEDLADLIEAKHEAQLLGGYAHVPPVAGAPAVPLASVPKQVRVGGDFCRNYVEGPHTDLPLCSACEVSGDVGLDPVQQRLPCALREPEVFPDLARQVRQLGSVGGASLPVFHLTGDKRADGRPTLPIPPRCVQQQTGHTRRKGDFACCVAVHSCGKEPMVRVSFEGHWLLKIPPGGCLYNDRFRFAPTGQGGGIVLGTVPGVFFYQGHEQHLVARSLSYDAYVRWMHRRLGAGPGSRAHKVAGFHSASYMLFLPRGYTAEGVESAPDMLPGGTFVQSQSRVLSYPTGEWGACVTLRRGALSIAGGLLSVKTPSKARRGVENHFVVVSSDSHDFAMSLVNIGKYSAMASVVVPDDEEALDYASSDEDVDLVNMTTMRRRTCD